MAATKTKISKPARYFILNPAGAIHEVTRERAMALMAMPGYRKPSKEQVQRYLKQKTQRFDQPIGDRFVPEPEEFDVEAMDV